MKAGDSSSKILLLCHMAAGIVAPLRVFQLKSLLGGIFSVWWLQVYLVLPGLLALAMGAAWYRGRAVRPYLIASTLYWAFSASTYVSDLRGGGLTTGQHVTGLALILLVVASLIGLSRSRRRGLG